MDDADIAKVFEELLVLEERMPLGLRAHFRDCAARWGHLKLERARTYDSVMPQLKGASMDTLLSDPRISRLRTLVSDSRLLGLVMLNIHHVATTRPATKA